MIKYYSPGFIFINCFLILFSLILTNKLTPLAKKLGHNLKILDIPNERKIHKNPIARSGGIAIYTGFIISLVLGFIFINSSNIQVNLNDISLLFTIIPTTFLFFSIGLVDDFLNVSAVLRLALQIMISIWVWDQGIKIDNLNFLFNKIIDINLPQFLSLFLTIIWITGITNAINWLDGMNGLLGLFTLITSLGFFTISFLTFKPILLIISSLLIGVSISFLYNNMFKLKIFMGDSGSLFFGSLLSLMGICLASDFNFSSNSYIITSLNPYIPLLLFSLPIIDTTRVVLKRISLNISPFYSDQRHFHHILAQKGLGSYQILLIIFGITQFSSTSAVQFLLERPSFISLGISLTILISTILLVRVNLKF